MEQNTPDKSAKNKSNSPFLLMMCSFGFLLSIGVDYFLDSKDRGLDWGQLIFVFILFIDYPVRYIYKLITGVDKETASRKIGAWTVRLFIVVILIILHRAYEHNRWFPNDRCGKTVLELKAAEKRYFNDYGGYTDINLYPYVNTGGKNKLSSDEGLEKWVSNVCEGGSFGEPWTLNLIQVCDNCQNYTITASSGKDRGYYVAYPNEKQDMDWIRLSSSEFIENSPIGRRERAIAQFFIVLSAIGIPVSIISHYVWKEANRKSLL